MILACVLYALYLDHLVVRQFEGRRWTLPAQVYAAPLELYAGLPLTSAALEHELQRLHYRRTDRPDHPGTYHLSGERIEVALRPARFADETRAAERLTITTTGAKGIESLRDATGKELPVLRLEPLLIGSIFPIHGEDRIVVSPEEVPPLLPLALKAVEDRKFDTHHGVDPVAVLRAAWVNLRARQIEQGGSTLTQQLVRSYFLSSRQTLSRKLREAVMAMALDAHFSKADLMNAYINEIFLGQDGDRAIHGFGLASQFYFGKPLSELELSEVSLLVAIVRGPSYYDPRRHPERALARRNLVLRQMAEQGVIKPEEATAAARRPLGVTKRPAGAYYPAYLDFVRRTLRRDYHDQDLTEAGLRIYTSLEPVAQDEAERALEHELARLDRQHKHPQGPLEGAVVITSPQSGDVIAIVGGRNVGYDGFDRALDARRSMGSLVKPFIYLTALESGRYNATTVVQDAPIDVQLTGGKHWTPDNFTHQIYGPVPVVRALAESINLATVAVGLDLGLPKVTATLQRFGLAQAPTQVPAMLLGAIEVTPLEAAQLFNGLANGGFRNPLRAVRAVISADAKPLKSFPLQVTQVASPEVTYQLDRMLVLVMDHGTGRPARSLLPPELVVAGKSGTSSDFRDSWFAGFSGGHLAVVWVGYDDNEPTGFTGSSGALPVWARIMAGLGTSSWNAPMPESLAEVHIEYPSGLRATPACATDIVAVAVPADAVIPPRPGCSFPESTTATSALGRAEEWLRGLVH
ncbi:MAG: penicillin-binding protein 1B [Gammaproteobacteria bacterium]|nr:penicillin-binding protein 1B [Gammaproteobacteria bacterium]MBV9726356.1 penicillin-binding protein 1B [Gammaproteobacteria bacterium]